MKGDVHELEFGSIPSCLLIHPENGQAILYGTNDKAEIMTETNELY